VTLRHLQAGSDYRIKATAYKAAGTAPADIISIEDSDSWVNISLGNDDRPSISDLKVRLLVQLFDGQASPRFEFTSGAQLNTGSPSMSVLGLSGIVSTIAGSGVSGFANATGTAATLGSPKGIAIDASGNLYISSLNRIRKITPEKVVTTLAGSGVASCVNGTGTAATFYNPTYLTVDGSGNIYVSDTSNYRIRKVTSSGVVSTLAGKGVASSVDGTGTAATVRPKGIYYNPLDNCLYFNDYYCVRKLRLSDNYVQTIAGVTSYGSADSTEALARFNTLEGITSDGKGNLYIVDNGNRRIRKLVTSNLAVSSVAGKGISMGGAAPLSFSTIYGLSVDSLGNFYVAEYGGHVIRKVSPQGLAVYFAGTYSSYGFADGTCTQAKLYYPYDLVMDATGTLYVTDSSNHRIRKIL
jgi:sugar lactone lactonase YvrE